MRSLPPIERESYRDDRQTTFNSGNTPASMTTCSCFNGDDFSDLRTLHGSPPKVVLLKLVNCTNQQVLKVLLRSADRMIELLQQDSVGVVEVG